MNEKLRKKTFTHKNYIIHHILQKYRTELASNRISYSLPQDLVLNKLLPLFVITNTVIASKKTSHVYRLSDGIIILIFYSYNFPISYSFLIVNRSHLRYQVI